MRTATRCHRSWRAQWQQAPALLASLGWTVATSEELEADDVMFSHARAEEERGGAALLLTGDRDLYGAVSERVAVAELRKGGQHGEIGPAAGARTLRRGARACSRLHRPARRPLRRPARRAGHRRQDRCRAAAAHGSLEDLLARGGAARRAAAETGMRPRTVAALRENAELLRTFKQIATLQRIEVEPPSDRSTDFAAGAFAARELGMLRLAERLEGMSRVD